MKVRFKTTFNDANNDSHIPLQTWRFSHLHRYHVSDEVLTLVLPKVMKSWATVSGSSGLQHLLTISHDITNEQQLTSWWSSSKSSCSSESRWSSSSSSKRRLETAGLGFSGAEPAWRCVNCWCWCVMIISENLVDQEVIFVNRATTTCDFTPTSLSFHMR